MPLHKVFHDHHFDLQGADIQKLVTLPPEI